MNNLPDGSDGAGDGPGTVRNAVGQRVSKVVEVVTEDETMHREAEG